METATYFLRGFLRGRKQPEEHFTSEARARKRAAYLGTVYDTVMLGREGQETVQHPQTIIRRRDLVSR